MINIYNKGRELSNSKKIILISICVALASQMHLYFLLPNFRVSVAIILFPLFLYYFNDVSTVKTAFSTSFAVYIWRLIIYFFTKGDVSSVALAYFPEIFFYLFYGIFFWIFNKKNKTFDLNQLFLNLVLTDYLANIVEVIFRQPSTLLNFKVHIGLVAVALLRSFLIWFILKVIKLYTMLLVKEQHEERYRKLLILSSQLKSEVFWMEKNMHHIERTMTEAYKLFENINLEKERETWADSALTIAKDIHEIKKEYALVVRGVREITFDKFKNEGMYFKDMIYILEKSMNDEISRRGKDIKLEISYEDNFYTKKHYYLMSVFRNLITNSVDAYGKDLKENKIIFKQEIKDNKHLFTIKDNACGINEEDLEFIFSPGYSTKINYNTGEVNRGIGLSLVKEIIEDVLGGKIYVYSKKGEGTEFQIYLDKEAFEDKNEDFHS